MVKENFMIKPACRRLFTILSKCVKSPPASSGLRPKASPWKRLTFSNGMYLRLTMILMTVMLMTHIDVHYLIGDVDRDSFFTIHVFGALFNKQQLKRLFYNYLHVWVVSKPKQHKL